MAGVKDYVMGQVAGLGEQAGKLREKPVEMARKSALKSAAGLRSLKEPVRAFSRSGVKLSGISHGTAQRLIELQEKVVTAALDDAAGQLERAGAGATARELAVDQVQVLMAARDRIVADMAEAVAILRSAGVDVRDVAGSTYAKVQKSAPKKKAAKNKAPKKKAKKKAAGKKKTAKRAAPAKKTARKTAKKKAKTSTRAKRR
jgi:hypothetical protein